MITNQQDLKKALEPLAKPVTSDRAWTGICCEKCWNASNDRCKCRCQGLHHGKGRLEKLVGEIEEALSRAA